jgi:uncharacterized protein (TIRG00374 family)
VSQQHAIARKNKHAARWFWISGSYLIAAACLFWSLHDIHFREFFHSVAGIRWPWVALAIFLQLLTYVCVAWEWQFLLCPAGYVSMPRLTQAVFAGRFANDILPVQLGYLVRVFLVAKWLKKNVATIVPSLLVERLWDGLWLAIGICVMAFFVPLSPQLLRARNILAIVVGTGIALVVFVVFRNRRKTSASRNEIFSRWKWIRKITSFVERMSDGVHRIGRSHVLPAVLSLAFLKLLIQAMSFYAMMWAYGFRFSFWIGVAVFLIAYLGICVPSTPAGAGLFQVCSIAGLRTFGVDKTEAAGFSLVAFVLLTLPLLVAGFLAFAQSGLTFRNLKNEADKWETERRG